MPFARKLRRSRLAAVIAAGVPALALLAGCAVSSSPSAASAAFAGLPPATAAHSGAGATAGRGTQAGHGATTRGAVAAGRTASLAARAAEARRARAGALDEVTSGANGSRRVTFWNRVQQTIWVAASPDASYPLARTGWILRPGRSVTIIVPDHWNGRFWGRTGCVFRHGTGHCQTGDCDGKFQCGGFGAIPATLAEYDLDAWDNLDFYDVSMVDGSNLPMYIHPTSGTPGKEVSRRGCIAAGCTTAVNCPAALQIKVDGTYVACESACAKLGGDQYCCRGKWAPRADCNPAKWPVDYARVFKRAEPYAYSYVDDDATSVYTCTGRCNYSIVFGVTPRQQRSARH